MISVIPSPVKTKVQNGNTLEGEIQLSKSGTE